MGTHIGTSRVEQGLGQLAEENPVHGICAVVVVLALFHTFWSSKGFSLPLDINFDEALE